MAASEVTGEAKPRAPKLVPVDELEARALREQAAALRALAFQLHRALLASSWEGVAEVRHELATIALGFDGIAEAIETKRK